MHFRVLAVFIVNGPAQSTFIINKIGILEKKSLNLPVSSSDI